MILTKILLLSLLIFPASVFGHGVKARINQHGIDYLTNCAKELLDKEIRGIPIPEYLIETDYGFKVEIKNAKLEDFSLPKLQPLLQEGGMVLTSSGGFVRGSLRYCWKKKIWIVEPLFPSSKCDNVLIDVSDIKLQMKLQWRPNSPIPAIDATSCNVNIENYSITGNLFTELLNGILGDFAKRSVEKEICPLLLKLIEVNINPKLANLPLIFEFGGRKNFDLEFFNIASFVGNYFMEVSADASINFLAQKCQVTNAMAFDAGMADKMTTGWASAPLFNCMFEALHAKDQLKYTINKTTPFASQYLLTTCKNSGQELPDCIGQVFPQLDWDYKDRQVELYMFSAAAPKIRVDTRGVVIEGQLHLNLSIDGSTETLAEFLINTTLVIVPNYQGNLLFATVVAETISIGLVPNSSKIGEGDKSAMELASRPLKIAAVKIVQPYLDDMGKVQPILGHKIDDTSVITAVDGYLRLDINLAKA